MTPALGKLLTTTKGVPKIGKPLQNVLAFVLLAGGAYYIYNKIKTELKTAAQKKKNDELYKDELDPKIKLSYKRSQYEAWADKLEDAIAGTLTNPTDEEEIYRVMRMLKTDNDWIELNRAFALRKWYDEYIPFHGGIDLNLVKQLQKDLDSKEKNKINEILKIRNIKYRI